MQLTKGIATNALELVPRPYVGLLNDPILRGGIPQMLISDGRTHTGHFGSAELSA